MADWYEVAAVAPGIWRTTEPFVSPLFSANLFTVHGRDADLQVDFGCGLAALRPALPLSDRPVVAVATHVHIDHVGAFHEFETRLGHRAEAGAFATMDDDATFQNLFRTNELGPSLLALPHADYDLADWALRPAPLTRTLAEGDRLDLGDKQFTVLHLPGHSPGCIALFDERNGHLFSGDAIYDDRLLDDIRGACIPDYVRTMTRLAGFDCQLVFGGHGPVFDRTRLRQIAADYVARKG